MAGQRHDARPLSESEMDELAHVLHDFITEGGFSRKEDIVARNQRLLLSHEADSALAGLILNYGDDEDVHQALNVHRSVLRRARAIGVRAAFQELWDTVQEGGPGDGTLSPQAAEALVEVIGEFITAEDWDAARALLDAHPELLSPEADAVFGGLLETHQARRELNVVRQLTIHRDLLRRCREIGVDAAFERMANPPDTLDMLVENTVAVLTGRAAEREAWQSAINLSRVRAAEQGDAPMLALLQAIGQLLAGTPPEDIQPPSGPTAGAWRRILDGIEAGRGQNRAPHTEQETGSRD